MEHGPEHHDSGQPQAPSTATAWWRRGLVRRWRDWRPWRGLAAPVSARSRRSLARQVRRTAEEVRKPRSKGRGQVVLHYRVAAVRDDLLEIAALLEHSADPDPGSLAAVRGLLRDAASPLYDPSVDPAQLRATLDKARDGLRPRRQEPGATNKPRDDLPHDKRWNHQFPDRTAADQHNRDGGRHR